MAQRSARSETPAQVQQKQVSTEFPRLGEAQTEAMLAMHKKLLAAYQQISSAWLARVKAEADFWSDVAAKMSSTQSVPHSLRAYQHCVTRRIQMVAEDGKRLVEDSQEIMNAMSGLCQRGELTKVRDLGERDSSQARKSRSSRRLGKQARKNSGKTAMLHRQQLLAPSEDRHLSSQWIELICKLRWIGIAEEAQRLQRALHTLASNEPGNLAIGPFDAMQGRSPGLTRSP